MGFLRAGDTNTQITKYSGLQVQTTSSATPVPIIYGRNIVAPNVFYYSNFQAHPQSSGKGGGKGGGGSSSATNYAYSADIMMGVCEGPVTQIGQIWQGSPTAINLAALGLSFFNGATPQAVWPYLQASNPGEALAYSGTCYVAAANFNLGASATVDDNNFEVYGVLQGTGANGVDADPSQVIYDFLTNSQYGVGLPAASINGAALYGDNSAGYQAFCYAAGLAISPVLNSQESAASILTRWLQITNSTAIWSDGMLKIIPFADSALSGDGWSYAPNLTPLYSLTDEDFLFTDGDDPLQIVRTDPYSAYNWQNLEIQARNDQYNTGPVPAFDQAAIDRFGLRIGPTVTAHEICDLSVAQASAQLILQRGLYIRNTYTFKLSEEFCLLEPMDLVEIADPAIGLAATVVRIIEIDEDDSGVLTVMAEEFPQGVATAVQYPTQAKSNGAPDTSVAPASVNPPIILEPPPSLTQNTVELWIGVSPAGGDPNWGGCIVSASLDQESYAEIAVINAPAKTGVLSAPLAAYSGANPDTADTLAVDLSSSAGALSSTTSAAAAQGVTVCYVGGEYLSYTTATLTSAAHYNLTGLYRGQGGLASQASATGASFCFLDAAVLKYAVPSVEIGQTIYLKFQSFNVFGGGLQSLAACAVYPYAVAGTGLLGPVASALAIGTPMDFGHVAGDSVAETDDYGNVTSTVTATIDLGNVTS